MEENKIKVLKSTELCGQQFKVYGTASEPLFEAKEVALMIGHSDVSMMMRQVDGDEKLIQTMLVSGQNRRIWMLTENGLYEVLMQSRKPIAKEFKKGIKAILKEIRMKGGYMVAKADETPEQIMARALMVAKDTIERQQSRIVEAESKNRALQNENSSLAKMNEAKDDTIKQMQPQVTFAKAVETSNRSILVGELARIIKQNGVEIGQNRLFVWMRKNGYLLTKGELYNQPSQKAMDKGLFEIKKTIISNPSGEQIVTTTTKVTGKGQLYFVNKFLGETAMCEKGGRA